MAENYRFCLSFFGDTPEKKSAGEFLKALGHFKSRFIIKAINEYRQNHPEVNVPTAVKFVSGVNKEELAEMIASEISKQLTEKYANSHEVSNPIIDSDFADSVSESLSAMLTNLDVFG